MKFNLNLLTTNPDVAVCLKEQHHDQVIKMIKQNKRESNDLTKITLFHGTTFRHLNSILSNGLLPRKKESSGNYPESVLPSNPELVYLTNKWHYLYAFNSVVANRAQNLPEYNEIDNFPVYIEFEVRIEDLVMDEDFFHSHYVFDKTKRLLEKRNSELKITAIECLDNYGTVAHLGVINPSKIISFTILGNMESFCKNFMHPKGPYMMDVYNWGKGKGTGKMTLMELCELEAQDDVNELNLTFWAKDFRKNSEDIVIISEFSPKETGNKNSYRITFQTVLSS